MGNIENQKRRAALCRIDQMGKCVCIEIINAIECRRRGKQRQMLGALREQPVEIDLVDAFRREHRLGNALRRVLVEIDICRAERQIEIGNHHFRSEQRRHAPCQIVGDGRGADATFCANESDGTADRIGLGIDEDGRDDTHDVGHRYRRDDILRNTRPDQLAVKPDIVVMADDHDFGAWIAIFRQLPKCFDQFVRLAARLQNDQVGRRSGLIKLYRGCDASHMDLEMGLCHTPVFAGALRSGWRHSRFRRTPESRSAGSAAMRSWRQRPAAARPRRLPDRNRKPGWSCRLPPARRLVFNFLARNRHKDRSVPDIHR